MKSRRILFIVTLVIQITLLSGYAAAQKSKCAILAESVMRTRNNEEAKYAFEICLPLAEKGDAEAQYHIGGLYSSHLGGIIPDDKETFKWMKLSAQQGYARAQWYIGQMYESGNTTIQKDLKLALSWYRKAAEQDEIPALLDMGRIYHKGIGTPVDAKEAVRWYERATEMNISNAMEALVTIYTKGLPGLPADSERARYWQQKLEDMKCKDEK